MSTDLKMLVVELEKALIQRGGSLDAPARDDIQSQLDRLKKAIEVADAEESRRLRVDALQLLGSLLSAITNVMSLLG